MRMSDWSADVCSSDLLDPAIGLGVRHVRETGDVALVGGLSMPLPIFDRNQGNVAAARANIRAAEAGLVSARASATVRAGNAIVNVEAAAARLEALEKAAVPEAAEAFPLPELASRKGKNGNASGRERVCQ